MFDKYLLIIIFILCLSLWLYKYFRTPYYKLSEEINPETTIFAFDLHNVVLKTDKLEVLGLLWKDFFKYVPFKILINPKNWVNIHEVIKDNVSIEYLFNNLEKAHPNLAPFKKLFSDIISAQDLNYKTIGILFALKFYNYKLYILSNIWPSSLEQLYTKYSILKDIFDGVYIPSEKNNYIAKPSPKFYKGFEDYLKNEQNLENKQIIFIDNSHKNISAARKLGISAIEFRSINNLIKFLVKTDVLEHKNINNN